MQWSHTVATRQKEFYYLLNKISASEFSKERETYERHQF